MLIIEAPNLKGYTGGDYGAQWVDGRATVSQSEYQRISANLVVEIVGNTAEELNNLKQENEVLKQENKNLRAELAELQKAKPNAEAPAAKRGRSSK